MYKLTDNESVIRLADGAYIPCDIGNRDYQDYLNWVAEGNVAESIDPPTTEEVTQYFIGIVQNYLDTTA